MKMEIPEDIEKELDVRGGIAYLMDILKEYPLEEKTNVHKVLSDGIRLKILILLNQQSLCVCLLKEILDIGDSKLSYHLSVLKNGGFIRGGREANFVVYEITDKGRRYL